ncbi:MAG: discoidin domain-containing protein, partial [Geminicoccaceae bacterium]
MTFEPRGHWPCPRSGWLVAGRALLFLILLASPGGFAQARMVDDFDDVAGWSAVASEGVSAEIAQDEGYGGMGMRLDFDFRGNTGSVVVRKQVTLPLPENYAFTFYVRGNAPENNFEFKLLDASGENAWWSDHPYFEFPSAWKKITIKKRHIEFAWGPAGGGELGEVATLEFGIAAGRGGKGSIWIDQLSFAERDADETYTLAPALRASTSAEGTAPEAVLDGDPSTIWHSGAVAEDQWLQFDFQKVREYGGLVIDWADDDFARAYDVQTSNDGQDWQTAFSVQEGNGGRDYVYMPDAESRYLRLELRKSSRGAGHGIEAIEVEPYQFAESPNDFFKAIAQASAKGTYPRYYLGQENYWTVVGVAGDDVRPLLDEDGRADIGEGWSSIEPFLYLDGQLVTWNDVQRTQALEDGYLPIPSATWSRDNLQLTVTAVAAGEPGTSSLYLRYQVRNDGTASRKGRLFLALRPFRVNPPWQTLGPGGGVTRVERLAYDGSTVLVNGDKPVVSLSQADGFGATRFESGSITEYLARGELPNETTVFDDFGYASGALEFGFDLQPGQSRSIYLAVPLHEGTPKIAGDLTDQDAQRVWTQAFDATAQKWRRELNRVVIELPRDDDKIANTLRSTLAYILINADGPALQPGPRAYRRSWIRDGALISAALLRMAHPEEVRKFIQWYSTYQFDNGQIPCCVDARGADHAVEHDSDGEWLYLLSEYYRYSHDVGLIADMWPSIVKTVEHIDFLRQQRRTEAYEASGNRLYYGLVPESISHEGYITNPVHSYWDNFFVLLGLKDVA